jgi:MoxR-like ATPase
MFDSKAMVKFAQQPKAYGLLKRLAEIEKDLNSRFYEMEQAIRALVLATATGDPLLLVGPPGTGKSLLIREFSEHLGIESYPWGEDGTSPKDVPDNYYFEYLLSPFTEPGELFGYYDIDALLGQGQHGDPASSTRRLRRLDQGMMQGASIVYLDEVFNGSSAILNSLLAFANERVYHDRGQPLTVKWQCLFAATNQVPEAPELRAIYDRFVLRCRVDNIREKKGSRPMPMQVGGLLGLGWRETYAAGVRKTEPAARRLATAIADFRTTLMQRSAMEGGLQPNQRSDFNNFLSGLVVLVRQMGLSDVSNRRLVRLVRVMLVYRLYRAVRDGEIGPSGDPKVPIELGTQELTLLIDYGLDRADDEHAIMKLQQFIKASTLS